MGHSDSPGAHPKMVQQEAGDSGEENAHQRFELTDFLGTSCESTNTDLQHTGSEGWPPLTVKRHQHKHSLKRRYEVLETLGKGTYGKVKKAVERRSGKTVRDIQNRRNFMSFMSVHI